MLSFAHPAILYLGAALAVPVLLHLMKRQTATDLVFPSIRFIRIGKLPREGRRRLRDILLLLLRLAVFSLVVFALARPEWISKNQPGLAPGGDTRSQHVIILDSSASMGGWKSFDTAKRKIRELLEKYRTADFALVLSDSSGYDAVPMGATPDQIIGKLQPLEPRPLAGSHYSTVENSVRLFSEKTEKTEKTIHIVSDFQLSDWQASGVCMIPPGITLDLVDSCPDRTENAGIAGALSKRLADGRTEVFAEVRNYGIREQVRTLALQAGSKEMKREIRVPAGKSVSFGFSTEEPDAKTGRLFLDPDEYAADDSYFLWLGGDPPTRVMAFMSEKEEPEKADEMLFLQKALSVSRGAGMEFVFLSYGLDEISKMELGAADMVFLSGAGAYLDEAQSAAVVKYVEKGGTLVATPGRAFGNSAAFLRQSGLMAVDYQGLAQSKGISSEFRIASVAENSILWQLFNGIDDSDLYTFPIYKYVKVSLSLPAESLLSTNGKHPFLAFQRKGEGQVYFFTVGFTADWSDFAFSTSFLPVVREIASSSAGNKGGGVMRIGCGERIPEGFGGYPGEVRGAPPEQGQTMKPGVLVSQKGVPLEINVSRLESVPEKQSLSLLKRRMSQDGSAAAGQQAAADDARGRGLWHLFALAALLALVAENLLGIYLDRKEALAEREA